MSIFLFLILVILLFSVGNSASKDVGGGWIESDDTGDDYDNDDDGLMMEQDDDNNVNIITEGKSNENEATESYEAPL